MATTTNYSWTTPDDTALVKDGAAAIRSLGTAIDTTVFNNASAGIAKTIVDAKGDIIAATAADTVASGWTGNAPFLAGETYTTVSGVITSKGKLPIAGVASLSLTLVGDGLQTLTTSGIDKTIGKTKVTVSTETTNPGVDAATDAANEATDAANAATDAALAAAEAADAATTAAQEASDAVAALSASVTKLIEGLQAQIKSLAAVVAKIAKKVKA